MSRGRDVSLFAIFLILMLSSAVWMYPFTMESEGVKQHATGEVALSGYTQHDPIDIRNDTALAFYAVSGTGDPGTPYILEGWNITTESAIGITVRDTTKYFVVRDCWLRGPDIDGGTGVWIYTVAVGTAMVERVHCESWGTGISLSSASEAIVRDCTVQECRSGIYLNLGNKGVIFNNTVHDGIYYGIEVASSSDVNVSQNICYRTNYNGMYGTNPMQGIGIYLHGGSGGIVYNNTCYDNRLNGFHIGGTSTLTRMNSATGNGESGFTIQGISHVCANNTAFGNDGWGIFVQGTAGTIANNTVWNNGRGVGLIPADNRIVENNILVDDGFYFEASSIAAYETISEKNNIVNGKPLALLISEMGTDYDGGFGQIILINCTSVELYNQNVSRSDIGAYLRWCTDIRIQHSHLDQNDEAGIMALHSSLLEFDNLTISMNAKDGCRIDSVTTTTLSKVKAYHNLDYGVRLSNSTGVVVTQSEIVENNRGIAFEQTGGASILNSNFVNNTLCGIFLNQLWTLNVYDNTFTNDGVSHQSFALSSLIGYSSTITGNLVNGQPLKFYSSLQNTTISTLHGQVFLVNCTDVTLSSQDCSNTVIGIGVLFSEGCSVIDSDCSHNKESGVMVWNSKFTLVENTVCDFAVYAGIRVGFSDNTSLIDNHCNNCNLGIALLNSQSGFIVGNTLSENANSGVYMISSDYTRVYSNICNENTVNGIYAESVVDLFVANNTCYSGDGAGIYIWDSSQLRIDDNDCELNSYGGIYLSITWECIISGNRIVENGATGLLISGGLAHDVILNWIVGNNDDGVRIISSNEGVVKRNVIALNDGYGLYLSSCDDKPVHHNLFVSNNHGESQGFDEGSTTNIWYDSNTAEGNYWSDWMGVGPYYVDGDSGYQDIYPLGEMDSDMDSLPDSWEIANGLDPYSSDSDSDSLPDAWEVAYGLNPLVDDTTGDLDEDGVSNLQEFILGLNPASEDSDGDLIPDLWELQNYLNPLFNDANLDPDGDGVSNIDEYLGGTSPHVYNAPSTTPPPTTTTPTTPTTPTEVPGDILPIILAAVGGFVLAIVLVCLIQRRPVPKKVG